MDTAEDVEALERLVGQLEALHSEISQLAKKTPNDAVNAFKLNLINKVLDAGNSVLTNSYRPFAEFELFNVDDVPTNSDVTMILAQYMEQAERFRSDNVRFSQHNWVYVLDGQPSTIRAAAPTKIGSKK